MKDKDVKSGVSLFGQSEEYLLDNDPIEEIFALNLGDFISEHLISEDLAKKISSNVKDKKEGLKNQLTELISIYSLKNTLCVLNFETKEDYAIYTSIAHSIKQMLEVENCNIYFSYEYAKVIDSEEHDLVLVGSSLKNLKHRGYNLDDNSIVSAAFNERDTITKDNVTAVSMHSNSRNVGVIAVESKREIPPRYISLVESIASLFATSMTLQSEIDYSEKILNDAHSNAGDFQHVRAELTALIGDLCDYQQNFVVQLAHAVDTKGHYTVSHSQNTANLARQICKAMGLNEKTTDLIYYAGLLQNIGKIMLPEEIFAANGKLSPEDLKKIQNHSNIGVNLLMNINFLSEVVPYINYQKERVDGSGEPEGLKGQSIPLGSRIIAVADAYSAMTSDRPFRKAMTKEKALSIIKEEAGKKWDADVVNALCDTQK